MHKKHTGKLFSKSIFILIALLAVLGASGPAAAVSPSDPFPRFAVLEPSIEFWISIYSRYTTRQGVLHDSRRLDIVYEILELENPDSAAGRRVNRRRIRAARKTYAAILRALAAGSSPRNSQHERVAALFGPDGGPADYRRAARRIRCQVGQRDRFRAGLIRSGAYLEIIRHILRAYELPEDLVFLPHVESSFNPKAYSKFGAAGIWQFTRSTGRRYMQVDYTVDERRDPIFASRAAAQLLKDNYEKLGSWPLAITAYNHGAAGMRRAQAVHGDYETIFRKYRSRTFKFASRNFYAEFLAAREVAADYERYFGTLTFDPPLRREEVRLDAYVPAAELIRHLNLDEPTLRELNPALRDPVFEGLKYIPKGYRLQLPAGNTSWPSALAGLPPTVFRNSQLPSRFHTVRRGETAGRIARRYGVRLDDLIAANGLGSRATIYVNQNLRLPVTEKASASKSEPAALAAASPPPEKAVQSPVISPSENQHPPEQSAVTDSATPNPPETTGAIADVPPQTAGEASDEASEGRAESGKNAPSSAGEVVADETVASLLTESAGRNAGGATTVEGPPDAVKSGAEAAGARVSSEPPSLSISDSGGIARPAASPSKVLENLPAAEDLLTGRLAVIEVRQGKNGPVGVIQVEAEETLGHYAEWLNVRAWDIRKLNGYRYGRMIHLGQKIHIPLHRVDRVEFEQQRYEYHKEMVEDFFAAFRVEALEAYSVRRGDTLWVLSREKFELPVWLIRRYNSAVDLHRLMPSDKLQIPIVEEAT